MTETPETSPSEEPAEQTATTDHSAGTESPQASVGKPPVRSPWLWLVAGLIAAIITPFTYQAAFDATPPLTAEHQQLSGIQEPNEEDAARLNELESNVKNGNVRRRLASVGIPVAIIFGLFAGIIYDRIGMGVLGAIVGAAIAFVAMPLVSQPILDLEDQALIGGGDDIKAMMLHSLQWIVVGVAAAAAMLIGSVKVGVGLKGLGLMTLAAVLGAVLYVIVGTALDANNQTSTIVPADGIARYLWTSVPPLIAGFFMARTQ